jgi:hypothetical protein
MPVTVVKTKSRSVDLINYVIPYIVSFLGIDFSRMGGVLSFIVFLTLLFWLTIKSKSIFMNPMLLLFGYNLYDLEYEYDNKRYETLVLSKYEMKKGERYYVRSLTRFIYFITKKERLQNENSNDATDDEFTQT